MNQSSHSRPAEGFPSNTTLFGDSQQQYNTYNDQLQSNGAGQTSYQTNWNGHNDTYALSTSRGQAPQTWASSHNVTGNHLHEQLGNANGQASHYARPISQSPGPYGPYGYNAPQSLPYAQSQPQYDPALFQTSNGQHFNRGTSSYQTSTTATIAPQALQQQVRSPAFTDRSAFPSPAERFGSNPFRNNVVDQRRLISSIPAGADAGLFSIIDFDTLAKATDTTRVGNYANIGLEPINWDCNKAALPAYVKRASRNELRRSAGNDSRLLAKIGKKSTKMQRIAAAPKSVHAASIAAAQGPTEKIKYEGEVSSEEESSSDDDDGSSYTSDDEPETAPLPAKRPDSAVAGTEYDAIKAVWRSKRKGLPSDSIRKGLVDFWEIAKSIRDQWKADGAALDEAKKKGQQKQLPLLESRVKDQRDMIEAAFKAALKHGHRSIIEIMSENESLIYVCYQFLLERVKAEDYNSPLPCAMLELMTQWTSLTEERLEKTHLNKVLARYAKYGSAKYTRFYANKITANAAIASKEAKGKVASAPAKKVSAAGAKVASPVDRQAEPVAGVKRAATTTAGEGTATKKVATGSAKPDGVAGSAKVNGVVKKAADAAKTSAAGPTGVTKTKTVTAKPSGIFSSLSAAKKPGTSNATRTALSTASKLAEKKANTPASKPGFSFAEAMAMVAKPKEEKPAQQKPEKQLPPETPEQKAKRLRKESRRHLRVSFKREDELTEVRFFTHDPDEELGHDASQMRDVADVGGEGRMLKQQHQMMDEDDDEEKAEVETKGLVEFKEPSVINFEDVSKEERDRNYAQCGGGRLEVESQERVKREYYDANNLIALYAAPEDIPPNPREPSNPYNGEAMEEDVRQFASPEQQYAVRARQKRAAQLAVRQQRQQQWPGQAAAPPLAFDLSQLQGLINPAPQQPNMQHPQPPQAPASATPDITSILASLQQGGMPTPPQMGAPPPPNFQPQAPPMMGGMHQPPPPPFTPQQQQQQQQQAPQITPDLAALLQSLGGGGGGQQGASFPNKTGQQPMMGSWLGQQQQQHARGENRMSQNPAGAAAMNNPKYKTKVCAYWQKGTCVRGEECSYKHEN